MANHSRSYGLSGVMRIAAKIDFPRLMKGALLLGAIAAAWKFEKPPANPASIQPESGLAETPAPSFARISPWARRKQIVLDTYAAINEDRLLAIAAGVVFYALLAIFPAITAFVSSYGLFADPTAVQEHLSLLSNVLPSGGLAIVQEQIARIAAQPSSLSFGFIFGLAVALWSANAGIKAMIDALNVIEERHERRGFLHLNLLSLSFTFGAIVFVLLAVGAVVAFPLVMSTFGLKAFTDNATWLIRWPVLFALVLLGLAVLYHFGPNRDDARRRWLTPGAVIAALGWLAGSAALSFYLSNFADYNATYGSLGAAIGLMMWMWLSAIVVLVGAELDTVIDREPMP